MSRFNLVVCILSRSKLWDQGKFRVRQIVKKVSFGVFGYRGSILRSIRKGRPGRRRSHRVHDRVTLTSMVMLTVCSVLLVLQPLVIRAVRRTSHVVLGIMF